MKVFSLALMALLWLGVTTTQAALTIPGANGSDGNLLITQNTVIDLSQAVTGTWDANNSANAGKGIYDAAQWAVVFKYSSVTVNAGATLSFVNHPSYAPVVWLVSGNVTITGTVSVNGANWTAAPGLAEPGPGGFRGGTSFFTPGVSASAGFGPGGGGFANVSFTNQGAGGSYGTQGGSGQPTYGNPSLIPLLGGSGGGGDQDNNSTGGGGAGGGALLVACAGSLTVNGSITANGGSRNSASNNNNAGGGSGGGLRLVAETLAGNGMVRATGGLGYDLHGGLGRIRVEYVSDTSALQVTPSPSVVHLAPASTALLWPPANAPQVKIVSIGGQSVPGDPQASFGTFGADVVLPEVATTQVVVETTNVEQASQVQVRVTPRANATFTVVNAVVNTVLSTNPLIVRWTANLPVSVGYAAVQVKVIRP